jgi:hypothetical protein
MGFLKNIFGSAGESSGNYSFPVCSQCKKAKPRDQFMSVPMLGGEELLVCKSCYPQFSANSVHLY